MFATATILMAALMLVDAVKTKPMTDRDAIRAVLREHNSKRKEVCVKFMAVRKRLNWRKKAAEESVKLWTKEKQWYNYKTNKCMEGKECRHYTQVVWDESVLIGCAMATGCKKTKYGNNVVSCRYEKGGNMCNWRPYRRKPSETCKCVMDNKVYRDWCTRG